ncbi:MAG: AraC family transcriptional regulator [Tannerella sp.]|jgi:AraC-like DNA-binding protein/mannose-6-phosphate isomerase-like protein (cupin superfamily)|nr:AraC family transcriptional regulator [Tannerella sp.]
MKEKETAELILLNVGYAVHQADWNYKHVNSPFARIYLVAEGKAKLHVKEHVHELTPSHLYLIPPFTLHSYACDDHYALYYIHIYEPPFSTRRVLEDYHFPVEQEATPLDALLVGRLLEINPGRDLKQYDPSDYDNSSTLMKNLTLHSRTPAYVTFETRGILFQLFARFFRHASPKYRTTDRIRKTLLYIREHLDHPIHIDELTDICCLSKDHFIRLFRKEMHATPVQYINQKKIEKAQRMILTGNQSMKDIAYCLSFDNVSYFNRLFKRYTGMTPVNYRKTACAPFTG